MSGVASNIVEALLPDVEGAATGPLAPDRDAAAVATVGLFLAERLQPHVPVGVTVATLLIMCPGALARIS
jgi:hypothetical protein